MTLDEFTKRAEAALSQHGTEDGAHDVYHARRVLQMSRRLAEGEADTDVDFRVLIAAAYFHDLVNLPKNHPARCRASARSAKAARPIMKGLGLNPAQIDNAAHAIEAHSYSAGIAPKTIEAKLLQDADRLEALGAIGIARTFYIAGGLGTPLFDGADPGAENRALDDRAFALDHFRVKLLGLAATMQTASGRAEAEKRTALMQDFYDQLVSDVMVGVAD